MPAAHSRYDNQKDRVLGVMLMMVNGACPDRDTLTALVLGTLAPESEESITVHLEACASCENRLQEIEQNTDPLIDALRRRANAPPTTENDLATPRESASPAATEPFHLDGYRILKEVGRGGMGVVYHAVQNKLDRAVAIKMILSGRLAGPEERVRFLMEGGLLARLNHPNFVQVYEVGTVELTTGVVQPYLVLEYVDGGNLSRQMAGKPMPVRDAARMTLVLARAIEAAHAQGIIHRDLKPANVLIAQDGTLKLSDFGLAKEIGSGDSLTPTGLTMGTPAYMAPEQARGDRTIGPAADVYAIGAILYEMLTGRPPFSGATPVDVILKVLEEPPTPIGRFRTDVPRDLATICQKCLAKEPASRYARAADLADDLEGWLEDRPIRARPAGRMERAVMWTRRHPLPAALLGLLGLSIIAGVTASTYFGLSATRRATEVGVALGKEADARQAADHRAAEYLLTNGQTLATAGEVDRGMFVMLRALESAPPADDELRRIIRLNLEAWLPHLPRMRWFNEDKAEHYCILDDQIICGRGNGVFALDTATGRPVGECREYPGAVVDIDAAGRLVCIRSDENGTPCLSVFERSSGKAVGQPILDSRGGDYIRRADQSLYVVKFSADGEVISREFSTHGGSIRTVWDVATGRELGPDLQRPTDLQGHLLRDGHGRRYWLFVDEVGLISVTDVDTGQDRRGEQRIPADVDRPAALFPDRGVLQSLYGSRRNSLAVWDVNRPLLVQPPWRLSRGSVGHRITADGRRLVSVSTDQRIDWHELAGQQACVPSAAAAHESRFTGDAVFAGPDGRSCLYVSPNRRIVKRFDFPRMRPARPPGDTNSASRTAYRAVPGPHFTQVAFSPDRSVALLAGASREHRGAFAVLTSTLDNRPLGLPLTECDSRPVFSPSGRLVAVSTWDDPIAGSNKPVFVQIFDVQTGRPRGPEFRTGSIPHALAFSPDERMLAVGQVNGATLCDPESGRMMHIPQPGPITRLLFSRDGQLLALAGREGWPRGRPGVQIWDTKSARPLGELVPMPDAPIVVPSEQDNTFVTVERHDGRVREWSFAHPDVVQDRGTLADWPARLKGQDIWAVDVSRRRLAVGSSQGAVYRCDLSTLQPLGPVTEFGRPVRSLAFSPDGRWLAVCGEDGEVGLCDPLTGQVAGPFLTIGEALCDVAFTPDGRQLLTAAVDGRITRWDLGGSQPLDPDQWRTWLEAATGMHTNGNALVPLSHAEYEARVATSAALPTALILAMEPLPLWHAEEARNALTAVEYNSARWHLDRWINLEPAAWLPLALRAKVSALEGNDDAARADLDRAAKLCPDDGLINWRRHEAAVGRLIGKSLNVLNPPE
jgi:WD40 repeat protein/anti-sigma factor RsiW